MKRLAILLFAVAALHADGVRQPSGIVGRSLAGPGEGRHSPSPETHILNRTVIDGHYSALPPAVEMRSQSAALPLGAVDLEDGGQISGPPQPVVLVNPEPSAWWMIAGGLFVLWLIRLKV